LKDCLRFEKLLWDLDKIELEDRASLESHLKSCARCRQANETISKLRQSYELDNQRLQGISPETFDSGVLAAIRRRPRYQILRETPSTSYNVRVAFSFLAAAAIVLFILKSVSDLGPIDMPKAPMPTLSQDDERRIINIQMNRQTESSLVMKDLAPSPEQPGNEAFSILSGPITAPSPESVNIDAVYVSSDSVPLIHQMELASLAEVYTDTGVVQESAPQVSVLITTEKMPKPIHIAVPDYPVWARKQGLSANVWVKAKVNSDGMVGDAIILSCDNTGVGFEEAATRAALKSQFLPASANGVTFAVWVIYPVRFIFRE
jgi:TonB family protein